MIRILFLADTHLGFDYPLNPRIERRRRGHDFFANFRRALQPALEGEVDLVLHGGDLFYRSRIPTEIVRMAMEPLVEVAARGLPVFIVPGNHERSRIPLHLWTAHPNIYIFHRPESFLLRVREVSISLVGFPFIRQVRDSFIPTLMETGYQDVPADIRVLCMHQVVEGAQVGPSDYTFRRGPEVIRGSDIPAGFAAVLSGHIHRSQILIRNLAGAPLKTPVVYPGSIERTSFAEREEEKHYTLVTLDRAQGLGGSLHEARFVSLPTRSMETVVIDVQDDAHKSLVGELRIHLAALDPEAVVRIHVAGEITPATMGAFRAKTLREIAQPGQNITLSLKTRKKLRALEGWVDF